MCDFSLPIVMCVIIGMRDLFDKNGTSLDNRMYTRVKYIYILYIYSYSVNLQ